ncbi:centrosomal protein of 41 kDa-like isoform X1 [Saccostrea echinata]|uniref:centrosomal protein of 41 kDa-like isoform X1 n=1 Tax=Saccostrea echinata TaxID=191078 RepID=UPI002A8190B8|nr:centrosomal protein of 41 kDa-like isoform X1 [Saccostrea echinata]
MSAVSTAKPKKADPLSKKTPENPKYAHIRHTIDTGSSVTRYMEKIEDIRKNYKFKKDEVFKRMKVTTFVQLIVQVAEYENRHSTQSTIGNGNYTDRPDTADLEVQHIQRGSPAPSLAVTEGDYGEGPRTGARSTLQGVVRGVGEVDTARPAQPPAKVEDFSCPYLLLDIRDSDAFEECHIITAKNYPKSMLSRATNYESKDMLAFKNQPGKIIVIYDEDERLAHEAATTLVQRGYDNLFLLSGGMRIAYRYFPEGLMTGTPNQNITESTKPPKTKEKASQKTFTTFDLEKLHTQLDNQLSDRSVGSRLSNASTMSSRMGQTSTSRTTSSVSGTVTGRPPFKPC